jgi:hypothetical protein
MGLIPKLLKNAAKPVTLYICTREALGSNLGQDNDYADWGIQWLSSVTTGKFDAV